MPIILALISIALMGGCRLVQVSPTFGDEIHLDALESGSVDLPWRSNQCSSAHDDVYFNRISVINRTDPCADSSAFHYRLQVNLTSWTHNRKGSIGDSLDNFGNTSGSTLALKTPVETALSWEAMPGFVRADLEYAPVSNFLLYLDLRVEKNLDAWHDDFAGFNAPLDPDSPLSLDPLNINEPSLAFAAWDHEWVHLTAGRFPVQWSPSPGYGVTLSQTVPYHDGFHVFLGGDRFRYTYLMSGMNPWLSGTPSRFTGEFPEGSEEYLQRVEPGNRSGDFNSRNRVYGEPVKTLVGHRAELRFHRLHLGVSELIMIGGKAPSLRDMGPFNVIHNNFGDGYSSGGAGADFKLLLPAGVTATGELFLDEVREADDDGGNPTTLGWVAGLFHRGEVSNLYFEHSLHFIYTDPFLYNHQRPYLKLTSRHVIKSNYIQLGSRPFVDTYVVDYPLGYFRGPDAVDLWYDLTVHAAKELSGYLQLGWLRQGVRDLYIIPDRSDLYSPTGEVEEEWRAALMGSATLGRWGLNLGYGLQYVLSEDHLSGNDHLHQQIFGGVSWTWKGQY